MNYPFADQEHHHFLNPVALTTGLAITNNPA